MQWFKVADGGNPNGTAKDRVGLTAGTTYLAKYWNDNFFNIFNFVTGQGYSLIDDNLEQFVKASKGKYNPAYTYNTSSIATQTVNDVVLGSDGRYYEVQSNAVVGDDPVGSITGNWAKVLLDVDAASNDQVAKGSYMTYGGIANAVTLTTLYGSPQTAYAIGQQFRFRATATNTGAMTINVDGLGVKTVLDIRNIATVAGEIRTNVDTVVTYDGTNFIADRHIERGSNANGEYVKLADGTSICHYEAPPSTLSSYTWTFPSVFVDIAYSSSYMSYAESQNSYEDRTFNVVGKTTSSLNFLRTQNGVANTANIGFSITAKGRWK